jgi:hypothetical protein
MAAWTDSDRIQAFASELFAYVAFIIRMRCDFWPTATTLVSLLTSTLIVMKIYFSLLPVERMPAFFIFILTLFGFMLRRAGNHSFQLKRY